MDINIIEIKDGDSSRPQEATSVNPPSKPFDGSGKKKRRRGKYKRKIMKPFMKAPWQDRRKNDKRNNRFRKIVLAKTHAPFNNNQFLMEIHKPEPENNFNISQTPSARTRDSSFSVDSEDNYFYSLPEDEEEYLTKEFSSVYEDAQCERLSNMSKNELIQEYLLLEAKYDTLVKRTERSRPRYNENDKDTTADRDIETEKDSMLTDRDMSASSVETSGTEEPSIDDMLQRIKEQEDQILVLQAANDTLKLENEHLRQRTHDSSSEDSESDSSSTSASSSSSSNTSTSPTNVPAPTVNGETASEVHNGHNGEVEDMQASYPLVNGIDQVSEISK